jgi:hypothetical protein
LTHPKDLVAIAGLSLIGGPVVGPHLNKIFKLERIDKNTRPLPCFLVKYRETRCEPQKEHFIISGITPEVHRFVGHNHVGQQMLVSSKSSCKAG